VIGALAALLLGAAQVTPPDAAQHLAALQESFLEAWSAADGARREAALRELQRLMPPGAAAGAPPSARALGRAWRALVRAGAEPDAAGTALELLAESLELRAVPGVFAPAETGEPLVVRVRSPQGLRPAGRLELALAWVAPDGAAQPARTSEAWPDAFAGLGFELFVRTPDGATPGTWRLRLELSDGTRRALVPDAPIECLAPDAAGGEGARASALRRELEAWRATGLPATAGLSAAALLDRRAGRFEPFETKGGPLWAWRADGELRAVAIVLSPARDAPMGPLCGVRGTAWREAAAAAGLLVLPWRAERGGDGLLADLPQVIAALAPGLERAPRVLVARGDSATRVALRPAERPPFDAWVLSWWGASDPRLPWPRTPARVLRAGAPAAGAALSDAAPLHLVRQGSGVALLDDLLAPALTCELAAGAGARAR
jgi:hypothetical protein